MHRKLLVGAIAVAVAGVALGAAAMTTTTSSTTLAVAKAADVTVLTTHLTVKTMPVGTVTFIRDHGRLDAKVNVYGLTPGSAHAIEIDRPGRTRPEVRINAITADATGRVSTTAKGVDTSWRLAWGSTFVIRLGNITNITNDFNRDPLAAEAIATTKALPANPAGRTFALHAVSRDTNGRSLGRLTGRAVLSYDAKAHTVTVRLTATGLAPNSAHAAHIHVGTCRSQGPVQVMFADFKADAYGNIVNQTRVATGVTTPPAAGKTYLNIHLGDMNSIVANGMPALSFRPLLCANI